MTMKNQLQAIYDKTHKPVTYVLILIAIISPHTPYEQLMQPAIAAAALLILQMLFAIENKVINHIANKQYPDFFNAVVDMQDVLDSQSRTAHLDVKWIGTSMDCGWPFIRKNLDRILDSNRACIINIEIYMLSPSYDRLEGLNSMWPGQTKSNSDDIHGWKKLIEGKYGDRISVTLCQYSSVPYYSGLLVSENILFLAQCSWGPTVYSVGSNSYTRYELKKGQGFREIDQFLKWAEFYNKESRPPMPVS